MTLMAGPLPLIILPLAMTPVVYCLGRWPAAASLLASVTALVTASLCLRLPLNNPVYVLGRELALDYPGQGVIAFIFITAAVLFFCAWLTSQGPAFDPPPGAGSAQEGRQAALNPDTAFIPFGLAILGLLSGVVTMRLFLFAALLLEITAIVAVFAIQSSQSRGYAGLGSTQAGLKYLTMTALALPCFLIAAWLFELHARYPHDTTLAGPTVILLASGFAILLGAVPFQVWLPSVAVSSPTVMAFLIGTVHPVLFWLMISLFQRHPWLMADTRALQILSAGGLVTALVGGLLALSQQDFGRLLAYAALSDLGCILSVLAMAPTAGPTAAALPLVHRSLALVLASLGVTTLRRYAVSDAFADLSHMARRMPLLSAGLLVGLFSLAGFPLTGGFTSRWPIYYLAYQENPLYALALVLSGGAVALGCWRGLLALFGPDTHPELGHEPLPIAIATLILTLLCLAWGLFPQLFSSLILKWIAGVNGHSPLPPNLTSLPIHRYFFHLPLPVTILQVFMLPSELI